MKRAKERDSSETAAIKINRRKVCLLIIAIGISVLLLITMLGLLHLEKSNTRRYREENHARFDVNTQAFQEVLDSSDAWIDNLKTSIYALPYLETASAADFLADLKQPGVKLTFDESPFPTDKNGNKLLGRLQGLIMASSSFSESAIYNPQTGVAVACVSNGHVGALSTEEEELCALLGISSLNTEEGALTEGRAAEHANAALYLTRVLDDGLVLLCGVTHEALNDSLLADNSGRSYLLKQMVCVFPDGGLLLRDPSRSLGALGLTPEELTRDASIEDIGNYTLMRHTLPEYGLQTVAILAETGATSVVSSEWIWLLLIVTALWLLVIIAMAFTCSSAYSARFPESAAASPRTPKPRRTICKASPTPSSATTSSCFPIRRPLRLSFPSCVEPIWSSWRWGRRRSSLRSSQNGWAFRSCWKNTCSSCFIPITGAG